MVTPAMQLAGKISDVHVQLWASSLLKGIVLFYGVCIYKFYGTRISISIFSLKKKNSV